MSTLEPPPDVPPEASSPSPDRSSKRTNPWIWVSVALAALSIGLLVWGLNTKSDLDKANKDNKQLESQLKAGAAAGTAAAASYKSAYNDLQQQVGATSQDLATTQQDLDKAKADAAKAEDEAAAAKKEADQANNETDKANAETKQAQAEAKAAESKAQITTECTKAFFSSIGKLLESDDPNSQLAAVKEDLNSISADCKDALAGT